MKSWKFHEILVFLALFVLIVSMSPQAHSPEFKTKVGPEAVRGMKTVTEIAQEYGVHPQSLGQWKKEIRENAGALFDVKRGPPAGR